MSDFKPFSGKNLDEAIAEAVKYLGVERDKLEIEIIHGGSSGIFGLVGKRKAEIKARKRPAPRPKGLDTVLAQPSVANESETAPAPESPECEAPKAKPQGLTLTLQPKAQPAPVETVAKTETQDIALAESTDATGSDENAAAREPRQGRSRGRGRGRGGNQTAPAGQDTEASAEQPKAQPRQPREERPRREPRPQREPREPREPRETRETREPRPERPSRPRRDEQSQVEGDDRLDQHAMEPEDNTPASEELLAMTREIAQGVLSRLLEQEVPLEISGTASRLTVTVVEEEHSGLLIGREGATLQALQYIMTRMLAKKCDQPIKVSLNAGEYREKQDQNLKKTALFLAEKVKNTGRPQSTKPLSSYHRRVVHLALQDDPEIVTRSKGDSALKRVIILLKRKGGAAQADQDISVEE